MIIDCALYIFCDIASNVVDQDDEKKESGKCLIHCLSDANSSSIT